MISNKWIVGVALMIFGIFSCFFGTKFTQYTEFVAGVLGTWFVLCFLIFSWLQITYSNLAFWLIIVGTLLVGLLVGYLISQFANTVAPMILGGFLGYLLGNFVYQFALKYIQSNPMVVYWIAMIVCVAAGVVVGCYFAEHILILSTAFIGAYSLIRGISFMAGNYPDERQVIDLINKGETEQIKNVSIFIYFSYSRGRFMLT